MNIKRAFSNGVSFGSVVGTALAALHLLGGPPNFLLIIPELLIGTFVGAAFGGVFFAAAHAITHTIPGLSTLMGEKSAAPPAPVRSQAPARAAHMTTDYGHPHHSNHVARLEAERSVNTYRGK